jgi:uncharacterized RDD family membrane protein YckC
MESLASGSSDENPWASFWVRVGAVVIDGLVLGLIGWVLGWLGGDRLAGLGGWERLIGLAVATGYFAILSSDLGGCRTVGMRVLGLIVLRTRGEPIDLGRSTGRALLIVLPWLANGVELGAVSSFGFAVLSVVFATLLFGVSLAQLYLLVFNRPSRRLLHDLVFDTMTVRLGAKHATLPRSRSAVVVAGSIVGIAALFSIVVQSGLLLVFVPAKIRGSFAALRSCYDAVRTQPGLTGVRIASWWDVNQPGQPPTIVLTARTNREPTADQAVSIRDRIFSHYAFSSGQRLRIGLRYGFDLGIASGWRGRSFDYVTPSFPPLQIALSHIPRTR